MGSVSDGPGHGMEEGDAMRRSMETLFMDAKVDVVLTGHIHMYERMHPVFDLKLSCEGPTHIMVGDGGNREGPACPWSHKEPQFLAFREFSFGYGLLTLKNETEAVWRWHRNQDDDYHVGDEVVVTRSGSH